MPLTPQTNPVSWQRMGQRVPQRRKEEFANALRAWRAKKEFTQAQAADYFDISLRTLQNWEIARTMPVGLACKLLLKEFARSESHRR